LTGYFHLAFTRLMKRLSERFTMRPLRRGNGQRKAGLRRPGYFAAFVLDPDGNNVEAAWRSL